MSKQNFVAFLLCCVAQCYFCAQLPSDIRKCHYGDAKCLVASINYVIKRYSKGLPEIGLEPFNEIHESKTTLVDTPKNSPYYLIFQVDKLTCLGFENTTITKVVGFDKDPTSTKIEIHGQVPRVLIRGPYRSYFKFLLVKVNAAGPLKIDLQNFRFIWTLKVIMEPRKNKRYLKITNLALVIDIDRFILKMDDYYNDNADMSYILNKALNDNWLAMWHELEPDAISKASKRIKQLLSNIFDKVSYDDLFLPESSIT